MSDRSVLSATKLMDLPNGLICYILTFLSDGNPQPLIEYGFSDSGSGRHIPLPVDLLPVAQSSRTLSTAVADVLGPRVVHIRSDICEADKNRLDQWVTALAPFVTAVTTGSSLEVFNKSCDLEPQEARRLGAVEETYEAAVSNFLYVLCRDTFKLLKSVSADNICLQVLEIVDVPFHRWNHRENELLPALVGALERNRESLTRLGLPVAELCTKALTRVTLKNLSVMKLEMHEWRESSSVSPEENTLQAVVFLQMLHAVNGHEARSQKSNTLQELRVVNIGAAPWADVAESGWTEGLFETISTLQLDTSHCSISQHDAMAIFVTLFRNLECLHSNGLLTGRNLRLINRACPNIREIHLSSDIFFVWGRAPAFTETTRVVEFKASELSEIFAASEGKFKRLLFNGKPNERQLRVLGQKNPGLEHLGMDVARSNVAGLGLLLGEHCRQIRRLKLMVAPDDGPVGLRRDGWQKLLEAIRRASDEFCEIIIDDEENYSEEEGTLFVLQAVVDIIDTLGERARKIVVSTGSYSREDLEGLLVTLRQILRTCSTKAKNLSVLQLDVYACISVDTGDHEEQCRELYRQFLHEKRELSEKVPNLRIRLYRVGAGEHWFDDDVMEA